MAIVMSLDFFPLYMSGVLFVKINYHILATNSS